MPDQDTQPATNRQVVLADKAAAAFRRFKRASRDAHAAYIEAGAALAEARDGAKRGQWGLILARVGIQERAAQHMIRLARSGVKPETVSVKGIRGTIRFLAICERDLETWVPGLDARFHLTRDEWDRMQAATDWLPLLGEAMNKFAAEDQAA